MQLIAQGAEAKIFKTGTSILKIREKKAYRHQNIDKKVRLHRMRKEAKLLNKANTLINAPKVIKIDEAQTTLEIECINAQKIAEVLESLPKQEQEQVAKEIGRQIAILHNNDMVHGDLTTSNMLYNGDVHVIDFGLGFINDKAEHKAVDLHVLEQAFCAKHHSIAKEMLEIIFTEYKNTQEQAKEIFNRLDKVQRRGRYKKKA